MNAAPLRAITFDLWDTVLVDDSDEPKRRELGLLPKKEERRRLLHRFLSAHGAIATEQVNAAYDRVDADFHRAWHQDLRTWSVQQRLRRLLSDLGRELPGEEFDELVRHHEEMELEVQPDLAPGVAAAIATLCDRYRLGVISDTVFSPGRVLRRMLREAGLLHPFSALVFSDELGRSKPHPSAFTTAADLLGVAPAELVHLGDREKNDVEGPRAVGARAILVTVVKDRRTGPSRAEAVCSDYRELPMLIEQLGGGR